jgi:transcriptional regulator with XRE-family HTH domain
VPFSSEQKKLLARVGANLRRERSSRGITQEKLAERADLNIRTIQKIEGGELNVLITTIVRIRRGVGCRLDELIPSE